MAASTYRDGVEAIRRAADIVEVVGDAVKLRRSGRSYVGLCPFHREKTPSFHVDPDKQVYYCFGCQAGGDVFRFVMTLHGVEFPEAVGLLADRYGLPRPRGAERVEDGGTRRRRRVLDALEAAQTAFVEELSSERGVAARAYLERRGLDAAARERFGLGLAPSGWDGLLRLLTGRGFSVDELRAAGLVVPRRSGDGVYDRFRGRITFPIRDTAGRIVSFGGRALGDDEPKYLNGPETDVYDKSRTLFRLSETAREIREAGRAVVVEGYFDAVSLGARGVPGVVAVCGTALGEAHAALLRRWTRTVVLLLDGDEAGRRAAHRALGPLLAAGLEVRVALAPEGLDPDDVARERGAEAVAALIDGALDLAGFLVEEGRRTFDVASVTGRVRALEMALAHIVRLESPVARAEMAARVADGLRIDDALIREELRRAARQRTRRLRDDPRRRPAADAPLRPAEQRLLRWITGPARENPAAAGELMPHIPFEALSPEARTLLERWDDARRAGETWGLRELAEAVGGPAGERLLALAFAPGPDPDEKEAWGCVAALREEHVKRRLGELQQRIETADDPAELEELVREKLALAQEVRAARGSRPEG